MACRGMGSLAGTCRANASVVFRSWSRSSFHGSLRGKRGVPSWIPPVTRKTMWVLYCSIYDIAEFDRKPAGLLGAAL